MEKNTFFKSYFSLLGRLMHSLNPEDISRIIDVFESARRSGRQIFFIGNGGSAVTAMHFANDLAALAVKGLPFRAIALVDNIAKITSIANDDGYASIFVRQLECLLKKKDILVAISASGNSKNIINAAKFAKRKGGVVVALVGFDGGGLKKIADHSILIKTKKGEYGPVEDMHLILDHLISSYFMYKFGLRRKHG